MVSILHVDLIICQHYISFCAKLLAQLVLKELRHRILSHSFDRLNSA